MAKWICTNCGAQYDSNNPPCMECAGEEFATIEESDDPETIEASDTIEWECEACGRRHVRNNPPCNKCGNMTFRRVEGSVGETERERSRSGERKSSSTRRETLMYGGAIAVALAGGGYLVLSRDLLGESYPTTTAPGESEKASGIRFETAETELREIINERREEEGVATLSPAGNVGAFATYCNKKWVTTGADGLDTLNTETIEDEFDVSGYVLLPNRFAYDSETSRRAIDYYDSASQLGRDCAESWFADARFRDPLTSSRYSKTGIDVHVGPDGGVFILAVLE